MVHNGVTTWLCESPGISTSLLSPHPTHTFGGGTPVTGTLWGDYSEQITVGSSTETAAQAQSRFELAAGGVAQVVRCYDFAAWIPKLQSNLQACGLGTRTTVGSFEQNGSHSLANIAAGAYDSDINALLTLISSTISGTGLKHYQIFAHEFDSKISKGTYGFSDVYPAMLHVDTLIYNHGDSNIISGIILTGNAFVSRMNSYWPTLSTGHYGLIGTDAYQGTAGAVGGSHNNATFQDDNQIIVDTINSMAPGLLWGTGETGWPIGVGPGTSGQNVAFIESLSWAQNLAAWMCWFNSGGDRIDNIPAEIAAYGVYL